LRELNIYGCEGLASLSGVVFPDQLEKLNLGLCTSITDLFSANFPANLLVLDLTRSGIRRLAGVIFPNRLRELNVLMCEGLTDLYDVRLPKSLKNLDFWGSANISILPRCLHRLPNLSYLNVEGTKISSYLEKAGFGFYVGYAPFGVSSLLEQIKLVMAGYKEEG
jgi:Leucine-rich repeat (LRR) protein